MNMTQTRMTRQRALILELLRRTTSHPTADEIYGLVRKKLPRISLGTIYRNLDLLTSFGEILRLERGGSQKRFDGNPEPHQHVRCTVCGRVGDVSVSVAPPPCGKVQAEGFTVLGVEIEFTGLCDQCAAETPELATGTE